MSLTDPFTGMFPASPLGKQETVQALRQDAIAELDAINLYQAHLNTITDPAARQVLEHVRDNEKEHFAEFVGAIERLDPEQAERLRTIHESGATVLPHAIGEMDKQVAMFDQEMMTLFEPIESQHRVAFPLVVKELWQMTYSELLDAINPKDYDSLQQARPVLRALFPEFTEVDKPDYANDYAYGIWRMANKGDEIHRVFTTDLSTRHRAIIGKALSEGKDVPQEVLSEYSNLQRVARGKVADKEPWEMTAGDIDAKYARAGETVDGRTVGENVDNQSSIEASLSNYTILDYIREIPLEGAPNPTFYSKYEKVRTWELSEEIRKSGRIDPLIVVDDGNPDPYILEGGHRFDALIMLGAKSFPALVVVDEGAYYDAVQLALRDGKPVPKDVLDEYSDTRAKVLPRIEDIRLGTPTPNDIAQLRPFAELAVRKWAPHSNVDAVMAGVWARLIGEEPDTSVAPAVDMIARHYLEAKASQLLPEAMAGIQSQVSPGHQLVFRTARDPREALLILSAVERGEPGDGFTASTHHVRDVVRKAVEVAQRKGKVPIYTSNYPSVSGFYQTWNAVAPIMFAMEIPDSAVIYTSNRAAGRNQGWAYTVTFPDTEIIIDGKQVERIWYVPDETVKDVTNWAVLLEETQNYSGGMKNVFYDRDPALAKAGADAIKDLRRPPESLGRPFLETPIKLTNVDLLKGDRVVLANGVVATAVGYREVGAAYKDVNPGVDAWIELRGYKGPEIRGLLDPLNMPEQMIVRVLKKGERITAGDLATIKEQNRPIFLEQIREAKRKNNEYLTSAIGDAFRTESLSERGREIDRLIEETISTRAETFDTSYRIAHRPREEGPRLYDLTEGEEGLRPDVYDHPEWYGAELKNKSSRESIAALRMVKGKPDAKVTIYRSAPAGVEILPGDWVSLSKNYAKESGYHPTDRKLDMPVHSKIVLAREVRFAGDDLNEFGYFPDQAFDVKASIAYYPRLDKTYTTEPLQLYHGTAEDFVDGDITTGKRMYGIHLTTSPEVARVYGDVKSYILSADAKILDLSDGDTLWEFMKREEILDEDQIDNIDLENYVKDGRLFQYEPFRHYLADDIARTGQAMGFDVLKMIDDLGHESDDIAYVVVNPSVLTPTEGFIVLDPLPLAYGLSKEPWQMTRKEYSIYGANAYIAGGDTRKAINAYEKWFADRELNWDRDALKLSFADRPVHELIVKWALSENKPVTAEVLADYPDLAVTRGKTLEEITLHDTKGLDAPTWAREELARQTLQRNMTKAEYDYALTQGRFDEAAASRKKLALIDKNLGWLNETFEGTRPAAIEDPVPGESMSEWVSGIGGSPGILIDPGLARATKCTRIDLGAGRKPLVYSPGIIGALDEGQEVLYCQEGMVQREASPAQLAHLQAMSEAAKTCSVEAKAVAEPREHIEAYFSCLGRELAKKHQER